MNAIGQLSPVERLRLSMTRGQAALALDDKEEMRRFLDEMKRMDQEIRPQISQMTQISPGNDGKAQPQPEGFSKASKASITGLRKRKAGKGLKADAAVLAFIKERTLAGVSASQISREMQEKFPEKAIAQTGVSARIRKWRANGELPAEAPQRHGGRKPKQSTGTEAGPTHRSSIPERPVLRGKHRQPTEEEKNFIKGRLVRGDTPAAIQRLLAERFGPDRAFDKSTIYKWKKEWAEAGELSDRQGRRSHPAKAQEESGPRIGVRGDEEEDPETFSATLPSTEAIERCLEEERNSMPTTITAGELGEILGLSEEEVDRQANFGTWTESDGEFVVDLLPGGVRRKVLSFYQE